MKKSSQKPIVIAEVGCNHKGEIELAKEHIRIASKALLPLSNTLIP